MKRILLLAAIAIAAGSSQVHAQQGVGKAYGSRDPQTCTVKNVPAAGAPTADQAKTYVTCSAEHIAFGNLFLVSDVVVQVSKGRPFNQKTDSAAGIDPAQQVYDIRGSFTGYQCEPLGKMVAGKMYGPEAGKNCSAHDQPNAQGICYKDTFGDWHCQMSDATAVADFRSTRRGVAPPK